MMVIIATLAIVSIVIQFLSRKIKEEEKPLCLAIIQYGIMITITILSAYSQIDSVKKENIYKYAQIELQILSKVSQYFYPVIMNIIEIQNNFVVVKNYLSFKKAKRSNPEISSMIDWYKIANKQQRKQLEKTKKAFHNIKYAASEILKLSMEYGDIIPEKTIKWAQKTVTMRFEEIDKYFDPYAPIGEYPKNSVIFYIKETGEAFGVVIGKIRRSTETIKSILSNKLLQRTGYTPAAEFER